MIIPLKGLLFTSIAIFFLTIIFSLYFRNVPHLLLKLRSLHPPEGPAAPPPSSNIILIETHGVAPRSLPN
jgi:hypothetical protein